MNKAPDKYKIQKIRLDKIIKSTSDESSFDDIKNIIFDAVIRMHKATIFVYQFLRAYILKEYDGNNICPITTDAVYMAYKTIFRNFTGKVNTSNQIMLDKFKDFYFNEFAELIGANDDNKINSKNLTEIINYSCTDIETNIRNNITVHFMKYFNFFINQCTKEFIVGQLNDLEGDQMVEKKSQLRTNLAHVKHDLLNGTETCTEVWLNNWAKENKPKILPVQYRVSIDNDLQVDPHKYLKYMLEMNKILEAKALKTFQFFPLRTDIVPKYIQIDTRSVVELLVDKGVKKYINNISIYKDEIWNKYFKMDHRIFKLKGYSFDHCICTDGYAASIRFIKNECVEDKIKKNNNRKLGRAAAAIERKE